MKKQYKIVLGSDVFTLTYQYLNGWRSTIFLVKLD